MSTTFVFDYVRGAWTWKCIADKNKVVKKSSGVFPYYLDCLADAKANGMSDAPVFVSPSGGWVSAPSHLRTAKPLRQR